MRRDAAGVIVPADGGCSLRVSIFAPKHLMETMAPKDPKKILLSKSLHFTPDEIERMTIAQAWKAVYAEEASRSRFRDLRPTICFTGFTAPEKVLLESIAGEKGMRTVQSVSLSLKFLCTGSNAGPVKVETAKRQGTLILSEVEFYAL
jgi:NAD-dependent DNA ligase